MENTKLRRRRKRKQKQKQKRGGYWGDAAKAFGNFWSTWHKALTWEGKKIRRWWNLMFQKELCYQMVELLLLDIKEFLEGSAA